MRHLFLVLTIALGAPACSQEPAPSALPPQPVAPEMFDPPRADAPPPGNGCAFDADGGTRAGATSPPDEPAPHADDSRKACSPTAASTVD